MQLATKLPEGLTGVSKLMGMSKEEVRAWPYYNELVSLFKDYNLKALSKSKLLEKLDGISDKCKQDDNIDYFCPVMEKVTASVKFFY